MAFEDDLYQESVEYMCQVDTLPPELQNVVVSLQILSIYRLLQDGSESGSERGYFLTPEEDDWPNCVPGDQQPNIVIPDCCLIQVQYAVHHRRCPLKGVGKWYRQPMKCPLWKHVRWPTIYTMYSVQ